MEIDADKIHEIRDGLQRLKKMCNTLKDLDKFTEIEKMQILLDEAIENGV